MYSVAKLYNNKTRVITSIVMITCCTKILPHSQTSCYCTHVFLVSCSLISLSSGGLSRTAISWKEVWIRHRLNAIFGSRLVTISSPDACIMSGLHVPLSPFERSTDQTTRLTAATPHSPDCMQHNAQLLKPPISPSWPGYPVCRKTFCRYTGNVYEQCETSLPYGTNCIIRTSMLIRARIRSHTFGNLQGIFPF